MGYESTKDRQTCWQLLLFLRSRRKVSLIETNTRIPCRDSLWNYYYECVLKLSPGFYRFFLFLWQNILQNEFETLVMPFLLSLMWLFWLKPWLVGQAKLSQAKPKTEDKLMRQLNYSHSDTSPPTSLGSGMCSAICNCFHANFCVSVSVSIGSVWWLHYNETHNNIAQQTHKSQPSH